MIKLAGLGRFAAATILFSGIAFGSVSAQEVSEDQIKAARAAINALGITNQFDNILPNLAEQLKSTMIQANPNFGDAINSTVDATALALAPRRSGARSCCNLRQGLLGRRAQGNRRFLQFSGWQEASEGRSARNPRTLQSCRYLEPGHFA